jgi:hypothetical protein
MNKLTIAGMALLGASAYFGMSCSSDDKKADTTTTTGGQGTAGTPAAGGSGQAGNAGTSTGGAGGGAASGVPVTNGYLTQGTAVKGTVWTSADSLGSTITRTPASMCASGTAIQIPTTDAGPNYSAWGAGMGWNLNQDMTDAGAGATNGADLSAFTKIAIGLSGATGLTLRVQLEVKDADGGASTYYCAALPTTGTGAAGVALSSLTQACWNSGGTAFDPQTMRPSAVAVNIVTSTSQAYTFNFCIPQLEFRA